ncbi:MAG: preprotein translocase subunit SecG [Clostridia bacterium]|nr:preprotein translocase subunit SecG [Clostridia bacterium]
MGTLEYILGSVLLAVCVLIVAAVLMQSGKDKKLSGAIAGGADTFFSKGKAGRLDKMLSKATVVISVVMLVLIVVLNCVA